MIQNVVKGYRVLTDDEKKRLEGLYGEKNRQSLPDDLQEVVKRGFAIEKEVVKNSLLFLSMNPSFSDNSWNNGTEEGENAYYNIPDLKNKISPKETNSFFQAINRFYKNLNINPQNPLAHHDLLFIRETNQKRVLDWKAQLDKKNTFFSKQLNLTQIGH